MLLLTGETISSNIDLQNGIGKGGEIGKIASFALKRLQRTYMNGARTFPPGPTEIKAVQVRLLSTFFLNHVGIETNPAACAPVERLLQSCAG